MEFPCKPQILSYPLVGITFREGNGTPLQYSCLENPMDGGAWWAAVHGVTKSRTRLRDFTFTFHFHALEKKMATHSSVLAWRILGTGEPGRLPSMGFAQSRTWLKRLSSSSSSRYNIYRRHVSLLWIPHWFLTVAELRIRSSFTRMPVLHVDFCKPKKIGVGNKRIMFSDKKKNI